MKKEDVASIIIFVLIIAIAIIFGVTVLQPRASITTLTQGEYVWGIVGSIVGGIVLNSVMFEVAHIVGAKIGRYDIILVNILGLTFYKNLDNQWKFKLSAPNGLTGEVRILPKQDAKKEPNPRPYLMFGTVFFLIEVIAIVSSFMLLEKTNADLAYFLIVGLFVILINIL